MAPPTAVTLGRISAEIMRLINQRRHDAGLPPLRLNRDLERAAQLHASDMVRRHYYSHTTPGGSTMAQRVLASGYARNRGFALAENMIWGTGRLATPGALVTGWMRSPEHRAPILGPYRDTGIGLAFGSPVDRGRHAWALTVTEDFGVIR